MGGRGDISMLQKSAITAEIDNKLQRLSDEQHLYCAEQLAQFIII